ncbi:acyl-CoA dehydrogenase [Streptomyces benahoarensis]|nr:acyl-CoA dehydrogenase family protein [Streptomyces benahoarensis]TSB28603.1 acyl-CoA dehydrogenase [Streptomyces benahoarensis]
MRLTAEQRELGSAVRAVLARHDRADAWRPLTEQIGVAGLGVPEAYGGSGGGARELHVVLTELGRTLSPLPFLGSAVLTTQAVLATRDERAHARLLPGLASGAVVGALAWAEDGSWDPVRIRTGAVAGPDGRWRLTGVKEHVLDGADAGLLLVAARTAHGVALFEVPADDPRARREALVPVDSTRAQARMVLDGAEGRLLGTDGDGTRVLAHVLDLAATALAAEQTGAAAHCLKRTVAYTGTRRQFGRPIGSFQAIKHRLADAYVQVEAARTAALAAACAADDRSPALPRLAAAAKSACSEAFTAVAGEMLQLHGGIALTWEHEAHHYFKRAYTSAQLFGSAAWHRGRLARELGLVG